MFRTASAQPGAPLVGVNVQNQDRPGPKPVPSLVCRETYAEVAEYRRTVRNAKILIVAVMVAAPVGLYLFFTLAVPHLDSYDMLTADALRTWWPLFLPVLEGFLAFRLVFAPLPDAVNAAYPSGVREY